MLLFILYYVAVRVNLTSASLDVNENDPGSVVCIALEGALALNVSATVVIGPKADATDPATGDTYTHRHTCIHTYAQIHIQTYTFSHILSLYSHICSHCTHMHTLIAHTHTNSTHTLTCSYTYMHKHTHSHGTYTHAHTLTAQFRTCTHFLNTHMTHLSPI